MLKIKPFQEKLGMSYCGPASLKMVLEFYGIQKTEEELAVIMDWDKDSGVDDQAIKKAAESFGLKAEIKNKSNFQDIEKWLSRKVPVIVDWFTSGRLDYTESDVPDGHYSVVVDLDEEYIYLQDPEIGHIRKLEKEDFMTVWFDFTGKYIKPEELIIRQLIAIYRGSEDSP